MAIVWVGHSLCPEDPADEDFIQEILDEKGNEGLKKIAMGKDESSLYPWLELTHDGEPICLNEIATGIADHSGTHVIQLNDYQPSMSVHL